MPPTPTATSVPLRGPGTVSVSVDLCVQDWSTGLTIDGICHFDLEMDVYRCDLNRSLGTDLNEDLVVDANDTCQAELGLDPHPTTPLFDYDAYTITGYQDTKEGWCTFGTGQTALTVPFEIIPPDPERSSRQAPALSTENQNTVPRTLEFQASGPLTIDSLHLHPDTTNPQFVDRVYNALDCNVQLSGAN